MEGDSGVNDDDVEHHDVQIDVLCLSALSVPVQYGIRGQSSSLRRQENHVSVFTLPLMLPCVTLMLPSVTSMLQSNISSFAISRKRFLK